MNGHLTTDNEPLTTDNQPLTTNQFDMPHAHETIERVFREEYGRIIATLIRLTGFDRAEEALQEAFTSASATWPTDGVPRNPGAWLTTVAHRKVVDSIRRDKTREAKQYQLEYETERLQIDEPLQGTNGEEYPDDRLRLIFTCCHPSISQDNQIALTLRTLGGLTTGEIARAFLLPETTLAQRLVRAKNKIRLAGIPYEVPAIEVIGERLQAVSSVIYLIFNEGYSATSGDSLLRRDLCAEAIRLGRLICELMSGEPENAGLVRDHRRSRIGRGRSPEVLDQLTDGDARILDWGRRRVSGRIELGQFVLFGLLDRTTRDSQSDEQDRNCAAPTTGHRSRLSCA